MSYEARNDEKVKRLIELNYAEGVSAENIARLLNYHFDQTFACNRDAHQRATIKRNPDGGNYAPPVTIWTQP